MTEVDR
jgi:hypothetical protein